MAIAWGQCDCVCQQDTLNKSVTPFKRANFYRLEKGSTGVYVEQWAKFPLQAM